MKDRHRTSSVLLRFNSPRVHVWEWESVRRRSSLKELDLSPSATSSRRIRGLTRDSRVEAHNGTHSSSPTSS